MWKYSEYRSSLEDFGLWSKSGPLHVLGSKIKLEHAAAAAKSLQSCPTLCDPMDGSPPGSPILGILQARTLEWVASSFSNAWKWEVKMKSLSRVWLFEASWTAAYQAPPSMEFSRQEYCSGLLLPSPILEHSHILLLHIFYGGIYAIMVELNSYDRYCIDPKVLNYLLSIPV